MIWPLSYIHKRREKRRRERMQQDQIIAAIAGFLEERGKKGDAAVSLPVHANTTETPT